MKILAVDDDPIILELLSHFVESMTDHQLVTASCAENALKVMQDHARRPFDCFLLDIQMPGSDGIALAAQIRTMDSYFDAPILMLTAMSEKQYFDSAFAAGATDYITKPFEVNELQARIGLVERVVESNRGKTRKVFATKALKAEPGKATPPIQLHEPVSIYEVDNVIEFRAMENYIQHLTRNDLFGSTVFAFTIRDIQNFHSAMTPFEFYSMLSDVSEVISDTLGSHQFLMTYAGSGTFLCITESGWSPEPKMLENSINIALSQIELFDNQGQMIEPRLCAGRAERLIWKSDASSVMHAVSIAHMSAEAAAQEYARIQQNFWQIGRLV
ncbi:response regulator [Sulfitobacter sp.]|jgi:CheY-like chemotaxis protein|uniref:response regulator n=1 Tax=Sulfitobacter sp. TaxID=1903071 RepID=UPI0035651053|tara:strand:+ start:261 stop:1247 length:987 start_codon:yes stop_codon:yes gene_type:complete